MRCLSEPSSNSRPARPLSFIPTRQTPVPASAPRKNWPFHSGICRRCRITIPDRPGDGAQKMNGFSMPSRAGCALIDFAAVLAAECDDRPAVVLAGLDQVELVAALRAVFGRPEGAGVGMDCEPLQVAVAVGVDLRLVSRLPDKRIVRRHGAVVFEPQDLAAVDVRVLRADAIVALADAHVEHAVLAERELRPEMDAAGVPVVGDEQVLHSTSALPSNRPRASAVVPSWLLPLRVGQVHELVLRELRVDGHFEQPALADREHFRSAGDRLRVERAAADDAQLARLSP